MVNLLMVMISSSNLWGQNGELLATVLLILYSVVIYVEPSLLTGEPDVKTCYTPSCTCTGDVYVE